MAWLNVPYLETPYRQFGTLALRHLVDAHLASQPNHKRPVPPSGMEVGEWPGAATLGTTDLWNVIRIWGTSFVCQHQATTEWARRWLDYGLAALPARTGHTPALWDAVVGQWTRAAYLDFTQGLWEGISLSTDQAHAFWQVSWELFLKQSGQLAPDEQQSVIRHRLQELADDQPRDMSVVYAVSTGIQQLCTAAGLPVRGPAWAFFHPVAWHIPENDPQWDLPLQVFGSVVGRPLSAEDADKHLRSTSTPWENLHALVRDARKSLTRFDFWFPVAHYPSVTPGRERITERVSVVSVDAGTAGLLASASGVQGLPAIKERDMFIVVSINAHSLEDAYTLAKFEPESILSFMRVADTRFRWPLADYYYWSAPGIQGPHHQFVAEWRDPYRLRLPQSVEQVGKVHQWVGAIASRGGELAKALVHAMHWQGLAYSQNTRETELIAWWIPLERLGHGNRHASDVLGKLGGWLWHWGMWQGLPPDQLQRGFYQDQQRMRSLMGAISRVRNEVVHSGHLPDNIDIDYVLWLMKHLTHDLTMATLTLVQDQGIGTFDELSAWLDKAMGFVA